MLLSKQEIQQIADNHYYMYGETSIEDVQAAIEEANNLIKTKLDTSRDAYMLLKKFEDLKYLQLINQKEYDNIMVNWDYYREMIAKGDKSSLPRDWFESIIEYCYYIGFEAGVKATVEEQK